jgi:uncharacterized protein
MNMNAEHNVQKVQQMFAAFGQGDIAAILQELADNVEWEQPGPASVPTAGRYHGTEGVASFFDKVGQTWEFERFEPQEFIAQGDHVVALGYYLARSRATQRRMEAQWAMLFTFRDGKLVHFREYTDTAAGEAAVR